MPGSPLFKGYLILPTLTYLVRFISILPGFNHSGRLKLPWMNGLILFLLIAQSLFSLTGFMPFATPQLLLSLLSKSSSSLKVLPHILQTITKKHVFLCLLASTAFSLIVDKLVPLCSWNNRFLEGVNHVLYIFVFPTGPRTILVRTGHSGNDRCLLHRDWKEQGVWASSSSERPNVQNT